MNWLYHLWALAFTTGRIYGNRPAIWTDEKPLFIADLRRFMGMMKQYKSRGMNTHLRRYTERIIKEVEAE